MTIRSNRLADAVNALLPALPDHAAYWTAHAAFDFGPALAAIARRHGLSWPIARFAAGDDVSCAGLG